MLRYCHPLLARMHGTRNQLRNIGASWGLVLASKQSRGSGGIVVGADARARGSGQRECRQPLRAQWHVTREREREMFGGQGCLMLVLSCVQFQWLLAGAWQRQWASERFQVRKM